MPERFNAGHLMAMVGATALLVSLFLDWYEPGLSAWEVFEIGDVLLAGLAIAALAITLPMRLPADAPRAARRGALAALDRRRGAGLRRRHAVNDPPAARGLALEFGAWLGLAGAVLTRRRRAAEQARSRS